MKLRLIIMFVFAAFTQLHAQVVDYDRVIIPADSLTDSYEERLVRVAWANYPKNSAAQSEFKIANENLRQARRDYITSLNFNVQYNTLQNNTNNTTVGGQRIPTSSFPALGLGMGVNIGTIVNRNSHVRQRREEVNVAQTTINTEKLFVRAETLRRYAAYQTLKSIISLHIEMAEDAQTVLSIVTSNFRNGSATLDEYQKAQDSYSKAKEIQLTTQGELKAAKITLEEMLAVPLEEVK